MWFKEYLFNLLIQPIHLLLYIVLVSSAIELAQTNMIYALVAIGFILQAENFVKQMFGIQGEGGAMASNFATGLAFGGIMSRLTSGASKAAKLVGGDKNKKNQRSNVRMHHSLREADSGAGRKLDNWNKNTSRTANSSGSNTPPIGIGASAGTPSAGSTSTGTPNTPIGGLGAQTGNTPIGGPATPSAAQNMSSGTTGGGLGASTQNTPIGGPSMPSMNVAPPKSVLSRKISRTASFIASGLGKTKGGRKVISGINSVKGSKVYKGAAGTLAKVNNKVNQMRNSKLGRGLGNVTRRFTSKKPIRKLAKLATMGALAGTGAAIGVAAGLASDDFKNVATLGATGAGGGALLGKELSKAAGGVARHGADAWDIGKQYALGDKYQDSLNAKLDDKWLRDPEVREYGDKWRNKMGEALEYRQQGITDQDTIDKGIKLREKYNDEQVKNGNPQNQISADQMANVMGLSDITRAEMVDNPNGVKAIISNMVNGDKNKVKQIMDLLERRHGLK